MLGLEFNMTLDQLAVLQAVVELGSLKAASEALHKTQPAISQSLKQLERQLGVNIVDRSGYRLDLTDNGRRIYQKSKRLLGEADDLRRLSGHLASGNEGRVTIAFDGTLDPTVLLQILKCIQEQFLETQIDLRQELQSGAIDAVLTRGADIAITPLSDMTLAELKVESLPVARQQLINVASPGLLSRVCDLDDIEQLKDAYQVIVRGAGQGTAGREGVGQEDQCKWFVNDYATKKALIMSGMGWGNLPSHMIQSELSSGALRELDLKHIRTRIELDHHALRPRRSVHGPVVSWIWANIFEACARSMAVEEPAGPN